MYRGNLIANVDVENVKLLNVNDSYQAAIGKRYDQGCPDKRPNGDDPHKGHEDFGQYSNGRLVHKLKLRCIESWRHVVSDRQQVPSQGVCPHV